MNIDSILKLARYHNLKGYIAIDVNGYAYWYKDKPQYSEVVGAWVIQFGSTITTKSICKLLCTQAKTNLSTDEALWHTKRIHIN